MASSKKWLITINNPAEHGYDHARILLLSCVGIPLCGLGVGLFKRLLSACA